MKKLLVFLMLATACRSQHPLPREAYAIGTYIGGGSVLWGPSTCTYEAAPTVAELATDQQGNKFMAKLIGPGTITQTCGDTKRVYDVLQATSGRISGPEIWKVGAAATDSLNFVPMAGTRELEGVHQGGIGPDWSLGKDCDGIATFGAVLGAADTGGRDISRTLIGQKAGTCTVIATVLGVTARKTVQIR